MGSCLCIRLSGGDAFLLYQFYVVSRQPSGETERVAPQIRSWSYLPAHRGHLHSFHATCPAACRGWGWGIFAFVWLSAIAGFILSFKKLKEHSNLETACYVGMGACILVAMKPLLDHLGELGATTAFWWLIGGGVSYIVGAVFYSLRKPYMHATFHLFCLGGSIGHIIAIWLIL